MVRQLGKTETDYIIANKGEWFDETSCEADKEIVSLITVRKKKDKQGIDEWVVSQCKMNTEYGELINFEITIIETFTEEKLANTRVKALAMLSDL